MKRTYIAGPMRGFPNYNFFIFNLIDNVLTANGYEVYNPARLDREAGEPWTDPAKPDWADETYPLTTQDVRRILRRDTDIIHSLRGEDGDAVIMLPGWRKSVGANLEFSLGRALMLPRFAFKFTKGGYSLRSLK